MWKESVGSSSSDLDSGAFSLYMKEVAPKAKGGTKRDFSFYESDQFWDYVDGYAEFVKKHKDVIDYYANVDVMFSASRSWQVLKYLEDEHGLNPVPVYHMGSDEAWLHRFLEDGYEFIAFGGLAATGSSPEARDWLDRAFGIVCDQPSRMPKVRVHGFAVTAYPLLIRYPWYCMTEEHEVLTQQGWKGRDQIQVGDMVLAFDNGESRWEPVLEVPKFQVDKASLTSMEDRAFSARVTPNHRWRVRHRKPWGSTRTHEIWSWKTTEQLNQNHEIPRVGEYQGPEETLPDWLVELFAWFWTEGSVKKRKRCKTPSIAIYQSLSANPEKVEMIRDALKRAGERYCESLDHRPNKTGGESVVVQFELYGHAKDALLSISGDKSIPMDFLCSLSKRQLRLFIKTSVLADGSLAKPMSYVRQHYTPWVKEHRRPERVEGDHFTLTQKRHDTVDAFRIACLLAGYSTSVHEVGESKAVRTSSVNQVRVQPTTEVNHSEYTGTLWCIRVPSGAFFTRCNDKVYVTGNSVDSATWTKVGAFGSILVPHRRDGKFTFEEPPYVICMSKDSPQAKEDNGRHFDTLTRIEQRTVLDWLAEIKMPFGEGNGEDMKVAGVSNRHTERKIANLLFFEALRKWLPEWPWPFKQPQARRRIT